MRRELLSVVGISSVVGSVVGMTVTGGTVRGFLQGALSGALISLLVTGARIAVGRLGASRRGFGVYVAVTALLTAAAISAGLATASLPWLLLEGFPPWRAYLVPFLAAVAISVAFTWWFALDRLLGAGVLRGLITGRYHQPRREDRIFLFADLQASTGLAEQLGELRYHAFLNRAFADAGEPVERHAGVIYQYVGDQMVVTWPLERGLRGWDCLWCPLAINETLREAGEDYERDFGAAPRFRFALHCGPVVAGEIGDLKREIVFSGDTLNTTARIEALAKEKKRDLVVSQEVLRRAELPPDLTVESLGVHMLRGKEMPLELFALAPR